MKKRLLEMLVILIKEAEGTVIIPDHVFVTSGNKRQEIIATYNREKEETTFSLRKMDRAEYLIKGIYLKMRQNIKIAIKSLIE